MEVFMKFLSVTDLHYSDRPTGSDNRCRSQSLKRLKAALDSHSAECDFAVCLGDVADGLEGFLPQEQGFNQTAELVRSYSLPFYFTFGNHDTSMDKRDFMRIFGMPGRYYSFETDSHLCLMLDTCMNSKDEPYPPKEIFWPECYIDDEQLAWLEEQIKASEKPVVIFTHILLTAGETNEEDHILNNADEVQAILLKYEDKIAATFSGHYHWGMSEKIGSIPAITLRSICMGENNTFAVIEIEGKTVKINGFGDEESREYKR